MTGASPRRAGPRDLEAVADLWLRLGEHHGALSSSFAVRRDAHARDEAREFVRRLLREPDAAAFLVESGDRAVGLCLVRVTRAPALSVERERAEISDLYVMPEARRSGIGRGLADAAVAWLRERGVPRVTVAVAEANREGQAFWRAIGFADLVDVLERRL